MKQRRTHPASSRSYHKPSSYNNETSRPRREHHVESSDTTPYTSPVRSNVHYFQDDLLPSPTLLQEYEYATDGAANRLLDMAKQEQAYRLAKEESQFAFYKKTIRIGQLCGFLLLALTLIETYFLIVSGNEQAGITLLVSVFSFALLASLGFAYMHQPPKNAKPAKSVAPNHSSAPTRQGQPQSQSHYQGKRHRRNRRKRY